MIRIKFLSGMLTLWEMSFTRQLTTCRMLHSAQYPHETCAMERHFHQAPYQFLRASVYSTPFLRIFGIIWKSRAYERRPKHHPRLEILIGHHRTLFTSWRGEGDFGVDSDGWSCETCSRKRRGISQSGSGRNGEAPRVEHGDMRLLAKETASAIWK